MKNINNPPIQRKSKGSNPDVLASSLADMTLNVKQFSSSVVNGDWTPAFMAAHNSLPSNGGIIEFSDDVTLKSAVVFTKKVTLKGRGVCTLNDTTRRPKATIYKDGNFDGITTKFPGSMIQDVHIEGKTGNGGNGIVVLSGVTTLYNVSSGLQGGDGIRLGGSLSENVNAFRLFNVYAFNNGGHGVHVEDTAQPTLPNANAGLIMGLYSNWNTGDGLYLQNSADNGLYSVCAQNNSGIGIHLGSHAQAHQIFTPYTEANTGGDIVLDSGSTENYVWGYRAVNTDGITDNGTANLILGRDAQYNFLPYFKSPLTFNTFNIQSSGNSGVWNFAKDGSGSNRDLVLSLLGTSANGSVRISGINSQILTLKPDQLAIGVGGSGTIIKKHMNQGATIDFASIPANSTADRTVTVTGVSIGDSVRVTAGDSSTPGTPLEAGLMVNAFVSAVNTVTVRLANITTTAIDPVSRAWKIDVWQH